VGPKKKGHFPKRMRKKREKGSAPFGTIRVRGERGFARILGGGGRKGSLENERRRKRGADYRTDDCNVSPEEGKRGNSIFF